MHLRTSSWTPLTCDSHFQPVARECCYDRDRVALRPCCDTRSLRRMCCSWAQEIIVCTPRIESSDGHATGWRTLINSISKVRLCIVGDRSPQLSNLGLFHARGALRLFGDHGRRHRACVFLFRQGINVRALVGSTRLMIGGPADGIESVTKFEGHWDDPFACALSDFIYQCIGRSRLPSSSELEFVKDSNTVSDPRPVNEAGIDKVVRIEDATLVREAQKRLIEMFKASAVKRRVKLGHRRVDAWWHSAFGIWAVFLGGRERFWNVFGVGEPVRNQPLNVSIAIDVSKREFGQEASGLLATEPNSEQRFLVYRGRQGRRAGDGTTTFWKKARLGGVDLITIGDSLAIRVALVCDIGSSMLVEQITSFVREVERINGAKPTTILEDGGELFLEADPSVQAEMVWEALFGLGLLRKDDVVRTAAVELRARKRLDFGRLDSAGPIHAAIAKAIARGIREGLLDRPRYKFVRAIQQDAKSYAVSLWKKCLLNSLDDNVTRREDAVRHAASWAVENLGLGHQNLRSGGRVDRGLRKAIAQCLREGSLRQHGRDMIQRVERTRGS